MSDRIMSSPKDAPEANSYSASSAAWAPMSRAASGTDSARPSGRLRHNPGPAGRRWGPFGPRTTLNNPDPADGLVVG